MTRNKTNSTIDPIDGGGPWTLRPSDKNGGDLQSGDIVSYTLRSFEYRNRKGYFVPWLPLDAVQITNLSPDNPVSLTVNGEFDFDVPPNATRTYSDTGIASLSVKNEGSTAITAGNLKIELSAERYDADAAAYEEKTEPVLLKLGKGLIGL